MDWKTAILNLGPAGVALVGVAITLLFTNQREKRQLRQQRILVGLQARRDAYAAYMRATRLMARHIRQRAFYYERGIAQPKKDDAAKVIFDKGDALIADVAATHAAAWLQASRQTRPAIQRLYNALKDFEPIAQEAELARRYDTETAKKAVDEIEAAEDACMEACRPDIEVEELGKRRLGWRKQQELPPAP